MKRRVPFDRIIKSKAEQVAIQGDWDRQRTTAEKVAERFADGYDTVLLADEVGMGKTYVALAVMADYLWQNQQNDRKVLLITPPSHVLRHKWIEEISSFSGKYVEGKGIKEMIPLNIGSHWELFRNLHRYQKNPVGQLRNAVREVFLRCLFDWASSNQLLGKKPRPWPAVRDVDRLGRDYLDFISTYSLASLRKFLDEEYRVEKEWFQVQFKLLKKNDAGQERPLANLLKRFANEPDAFEPNVYVISMSSLKAPRINEEDNQLFSEYLVGHLVSGLHAKSKALIVAALERDNVLRERAAYERWQSYRKKILLTSRCDLYGLRAATMRVVERGDVQAQWTALRARIKEGGGDSHVFFHWVRDLVFRAKLAESNIGLAVVDEVHNWKEGSHNASAFASQYASVIPHKLIMSATPFQVEQGEMKRVFDFVAHPDGNSAAATRTIFDANRGVIHSCLKASDTFAAAWRSLPVDLDNEEGAALLGATGNSVIRSAAKKIAKDGEAGEPLADFARELLAYRVAIDRLQEQLRPIVIRHTKPRDKRDFRIGEHFHGGHPDGEPRTALYPSQGYGDEDGAMVNFIGMRLGQLVSRGAADKPKTAAKLLRGLSSSTEAFRNGASARGLAGSHGNYGRMFAQVLAAATHPKVEATVTRAFDNFLAGRKTLIFCERVQTLEELRSALTQRIDAYHAGLYEVDTIQRSTLMSRSDLVDNLWWVSLGDAFQQSETFGKALTTHEFGAQAFVRAGLNQAGAKSSERRIIRLLDVYLLAHTAARNQKLMARWPHALGLFLGLHTALTSGPEERRGSLLRAYVNGTDGQEADMTRDGDDDPDDVARVLQSQYRGRKNLWCGDARAAFHTVLWNLLDSEAARLMSTEHEELPLRAFIDIVQHLMLGLRRVALREDLITRYEAQQHGGTHFERISAGFAHMDIGHGETMLLRTQRFVAGLLAEDGSINPADQGESKRKSMWSGIWRTSADHVSKMDGRTNPATRRRLCASFNSPLLPDILVCSAIGSEGIDLHRHCADIIHHDLPWNPAKLEQRIGRLDRVNSLADPARNVRLTVGIPFLANDYEKYQYDVVFSRAQKFEILLGTPDFQKVGIDEELYDEEEESIRESEDIAAGQAGELMRALPEPLIRFLKVDLTVAGSSV